MEKFGVGQGVRRAEDPRLLRGRGLFTNDVNLPHQTYAIVLRSPYAHAEMKSIDTSAAKAAPGVQGVFTGEDVAADNLGVPGMPAKWKRPDGEPMKYRPQPPLALGRVRYVGDPVALVVADTLDQARDAAELIEVDYQDLPSITNTEKTVDPDAALVWDDFPDNVSGQYQAGDADAVEAAFASAARIVKRRFVISRVFAQYMEPRGAIGAYDEREDRYTLHADVQYPHRVRQLLAEKIFNIPEQAVRVVARDVGGGFGTKGWQYAEHRLVLWASRKIGRPVKWNCERSEAVMADEHGRDNVTEKPAVRICQCRHPDRRVQNPRGPCDRPHGPFEHQSHRALSRCRPARSHLCDRANVRRIRTRDRCRSGRTTRTEHDRVGCHAAEDGARPVL